MAVELRLAQCPICLKRENARNHDLLCGACVHDKIEIIRNSVVENEKTIHVIREEVNEVFRKCEIARHRQSGEPVLGVRDNVESTDEAAKRDQNSQLQKLPRPNQTSINHLALQLQKLDIVNTRARIAGVLRTQESLREKVAGMEQKIAQLRREILNKKQQINTRQAQLSETFISRSDSLNVDIFRLQGNGMRYVLKQAASHQLNNFMVVKEVAFPNLEKYKAQANGLRSSRGRSKLELFSQPVIPLQQFLAYNNKLETINTFLENLIHLQKLICDLLRVTGTDIELPYLPALEKLLPDSKFYELVQKKINLIMDDVPDSTEDSVANTGSVHSDSPQVVLATDGKDKIVVKDNVIHIPISFRTMNLQRRLSLKSPTKESFELEKAELSPPVSPKTKTRKDSVLAGKQFVMVPHKILNKPFTRLLTEEYLRFLLVVSKIVINFQVLLRQTVDTLPEKKLRKQTSMNSLASTINQLRFNGSLLSSMIVPSEPESDTGICDFEKILVKLSDLDLYFQHLEQKQVKQLDKERLSRSTSSVGLNLQPSPTTPQSLYTEAEESIDKLESVHEAAQTKNSKFQKIYQTIFGKPSVLVPKGETAQFEHIYGLVSETELEFDKNMAVSENLEISKEPENSDELDPRKIMKSVYLLIAKGSGGSRAQSMGSATDEAIKTATFSMMEQSRHQLEDWDVLSRVF